MKKFSVVTIFTEEREEIFYEGFTEMDDLTDSDEFVEALLEIPSSKLVDVEIENMVLMERPCIDGEKLNIEDIEDIKEKELDSLIDNFEKLLEENYIYCEDVIEFKINGIGKYETEYIDTTEK